MLATHLLHSPESKKLVQRLHIETSKILNRHYHLVRTWVHCFWAQRFSCIICRQTFNGTVESLFPSQPNRTGKFIISKRMVSTCFPIFGKKGKNINFFLITITNKQMKLIFFPFFILSLSPNGPQMKNSRQNPTTGVENLHTQITPIKYLHVYKWNLSRNEEYTDRLKNPEQNNRLMIEIHRSQNGGSRLLNGDVLMEIQRSGKLIRRRFIDGEVWD